MDWRLRSTSRAFRPNHSNCKASRRRVTASIVQPIADEEIHAALAHLDVLGPSARAGDVAIAAGSRVEPDQMRAPIVGGNARVGRQIDGERESGGIVVHAH